MSRLTKQTQRRFETFYDETYLCETLCLCFPQKIAGYFREYKRLISLKKNIEQ